MKLSSQARCLCALALLVSGCQVVTVPDLPSLGTLDFNIDSASYVARAGETLESIAFRYNTTEARLLQLNPSAANGVYTGMELLIRQPSASNPNNVIQEAGWARPSTELASNSVQASPTVSRRPVPQAPVASDESLLRSEPVVRTAPIRPEILRERPASYVEPQRTYIEPKGFPVEEVIDDENYVIPGADTVPADLPTEYTEYTDYVGWQWPLQGQLARDYDPGRPNGRGIEIIGTPGDEVRATRGGVVNWVARSPDGVGKVVIIRHEGDYLSVYSNADDLFVSMNDTVNQGDPIASLGANANDEPLLRFEISKEGKWLNPMDFLSPR